MRLIYEPKTDTVIFPKDAVLLEFPGSVIPVDFDLMNFADNPLITVVPLDTVLDYPDDLAAAAQAVIDAWSGGDLAGAVNALRLALEEN